ncbi:hypothetical protein BU14_1309s0003 [Porphyra umbilicalis]|uniref:Uncharacterized protein n=1 Tax=Porphyra umbilicalis TaxID=2786 RepID=A0A1X6NLX5_PORUM|nr:hypothetical protein BU14_1309s0003 [Porphyra umbilicalis]|eukprot:OSX69649.1 hypothetical protein BU14_1309s0003 [Porphyra umbilicalis]
MAVARSVAARAVGLLSASHRHMTALAPAAAAAGTPTALGAPRRAAAATGGRGVPPPPPTPPAAASPASLSTGRRRPTRPRRRLISHDENYDKIDVLLARYPSNYRASGVIPLLDLAQRQAGGWLPLSAMNKVAKILGMSPVKVYEVATFYTMFVREPIGTYHIQVCGTTPCMLRGARDIVAAATEEAGCVVGGTSADGLFHVTEVECLGACVNAPMAQISSTTADPYVEDLTPASMKEVIRTLRAGKELRVGPQTDRPGCAGPKGKTSLLGDVAGPYCRELKADG